jgi:hypothetical protein
MNVFQPLQIKIGGAGSLPFKSIDEIVWDDIPPFAVLTGLNGSGKTQLLELLAYRLTGAEHLLWPNIDKTKVVISGDNFGPDDVAYLPMSGAITSWGPLGFSEIQTTKLQLFNELVTQNRGRGDIRMRTRRARFAKELGVNDISSLSQDEFVNKLPDDFALMLEDTDVVIGLSHVFLAYKKIRQERRLCLS